MAAPSAPSAQTRANIDQELATKYRAPLARARKLQAEGKLDEAVEAFILASGKGQDIYHRAIAELGYLDVVNQRGTKDEIEFELRVATASPETEVRAQAWFNLATLYRNTSDLEAERVALARSLSLRENSAARHELGKRSTCVAELGGQGRVNQPKVVAGWGGVCMEVQRCQSPSDKDARRKSCLTSPMVATPEESHGCTSDPPWDSTFDYNMYTYSKAFIAPAGKGRFFVLQERLGGWPSVCGGEHDFSAELVGTYVRVQQAVTSSAVARGHEMPNGDPENGLCWDTPEVRTIAVFASASTKALAAVTLVEGFDVDVKLDVDAKRLLLSGGNCDGFVPLDGTLRLVR